MKFILPSYSKTLGILVLVFTSITGIAQSNTTEFTVDGLKVILHQTQKETVVMSMYFKGGSTNYINANAGIESLAMSAALECGNSKFAANDFNDQVDEYGLHLSGEASDDYSVIKMACISTYADKAWQLFSSAIASPAFDLQKFGLLKEQKINELKQSMSSPDDRLDQLAHEFAFATTTYSINPNGTVASLSALTRDAVKNYYLTTLLNKNRMFLVVAGKMTREDLEKKIKEAFATIPVAPYNPIRVDAPVFLRETTKIEPYRIATNYISGIVPAPDLNSPDYPAFRMAVTILNSAMFEVIRLDRNLSYAPYASMSEGKISYVKMYASTSQPRETVAAIRNILDMIKGTTYPNKLIESIRKGLLQSYSKHQERMAEIADNLGKAEIMGNWQLAENLEDRINNVKPDDVRDVLNVYCKNIAWVYIGEKGLGEESFRR
jgi:zinc protease